MGDSRKPVTDPTDEVKAVFNPNTEITSNYYGSGPQGDGPGHGHIDVNSAGEIVGEPQPTNRNQ